MSQSTTTPFKDRRAGLIIFGVLEILLGCLCVLLVPAMFFGQQMQAEMTGQPVNYQMIIPGAVFYLVIAAAFVWLGIGSIKCRRWARAMLLVLSWSWLIVGIISVAACAFVMPQIAASQPDAPTIWIGMAIAGIILLIVFIIIPGVLVLFYRSPHVRATCERRDPLVRWTDACPLPVLAGSLWLGLGAASLFMMPLGYKAVMPLFGTLVSGPVASILFVAMGVLWVWLAWGLYRLNASAWLTAIVVIVLFGVSTAVTFMRVDIMDLYRQMGYPEQQIEQIKQFGFITSKMMAAWTATSFLLILGYLLWIKKHFRCDMLNHLVAGIVTLLAGLGVFLWARGHSPNVDLGEAFMKTLANPNAYVLDPTLYNIVLMLCALFGIVGVILIVFGISEKVRKN